MKQKIIGQQISKVMYSEVNHHDAKFAFDGFDTFDHAINVQMKNGFWWNFGWKDDEYFELGEGLFERNQHLSTDEVKSWDASERWKDYLSSNISGFNVIHIDEAKFIPWKIEIEFKNEERLTILIAEELNLDESIPYPLDYEFGGEIYVFFNQNLLKNQNNSCQQKPI